MEAMAVVAMAPVQPARVVAEARAQGRAVAWAAVEEVKSEAKGAVVTAEGMRVAVGRAREFQVKEAAGDEVRVPANGTSGVRKIPGQSGERHLRRGICSKPPCAC